MNEVNWLDLISNRPIEKSINIRDNANSLLCEKCYDTCCGNNRLLTNITDFDISKNSSCGCWYSNGCQKCYYLKFTRK